MKLTKRQIAGFLAEKSPEDATIKDVRRWAEAPRFNADDPNGTGHSVSVPHDDWRRYVAYFKRHRGFSESETLALAQLAWKHATARMEWRAVFDLMKEEAGIRPPTGRAKRPAVRPRR